jgi:hypothetical protein
VCVFGRPRLVRSREVELKTLPFDVGQIGSVAPVHARERRSLPYLIRFSKQSQRAYSQKPSLLTALIPAAAVTIGATRERLPGEGELYVGREQDLYPYSPSSIEGVSSESGLPACRFLGNTCGIKSRGYNKLLKKGF